MLAAPRPADLVRAHQGLVVLGGALLLAAAMGALVAVSETGRARQAGVRGPDLVTWTARLVTEAVAWLVPVPVLVGVPRLLRLPEGERERRWASRVLVGTAVLGAGLAVLDVVAFALAIVGGSDRAATEPAAVLATGVVAAAVAGLASTALSRDA